MKKIILEWKYDPKSYFESDIVFDDNELRMRMFDGSVKLELLNYNSDFEPDHEKYNSFVESYFIAEMIGKRTYYDLKIGAIVIEDNDGLKEEILIPWIVTHNMSFSAKVRVIKNDKDGNILYDSEEEEKKKLLELLKNIQNVYDKDEVVPHIIKSFKNSILFPDDELVYLYEIIDAIQTYFKSKSKALHELKISKANWSELGKICNKLPLKQGRHRGQMIGTIKDSSAFELETARSISKKIIHTFIDYLNRKNTP